MSDTPMRDLLLAVAAMLNPSASASEWNAVEAASEFQHRVTAYGIVDWLRQWGVEGAHRGCAGLLEQQLADEGFERPEVQP